MKQGYDDGLFREGTGTLADVDLDAPADSAEASGDDEWDDDDSELDPADDDPLRDDTGSRQAS